MSDGGSGEMKESIARRAEGPESDRGRERGIDRSIQCIHFKNTRITVTSDDPRPI